ncbi:hypothetical protein JCM8208_001414 [Rhodotorula glutinis]
MGAQRHRAVVEYPPHLASVSPPEPRLPSSRTTASTSSSAHASKLDHDSTHQHNAHGQQIGKVLRARPPVPAAAPEPLARTSTSPTSSEASFDDEILLVAHRPRPPPSLPSAQPPVGSRAAPREPVEAPQHVVTSVSPPAFATHRRWTFDFLDPPVVPRALSNKAKGKLPLVGERAVLPMKRSASPHSSRQPKKLHLDAAFVGVEVPVASSSSSSSSSPGPVEAGPEPVRRRSTPNNSEASPRAPSAAPEDVQAASAAERRRSSRFQFAAEQPPSSRRSSSANSASSSTSYTASEQRDGGRASSLPAARLPPPGLDPVLRRARPSATRGATCLDTVLSRARSGLDVVPTGAPPPAANVVAGNFPSRSPNHPLNALRLRAAPSRPPPRIVFNPTFGPAAALGWVPGAVLKKRVPPRPLPRPRLGAPPAAAAVAVTAAAAPGPAPVDVGDDPQRRSGRAKFPAQLASSTYPSATSRVADLAMPASASTSRASSVATEEARTFMAPVSARAAPVGPAQPVRRKGLLAQLRARYAFLAEDNCAPFRADNSCDGVNPEPCSFEWDPYEVRAAVRAEGWPTWREEDVEMERDAGEAADLILRAQAGDEGARDEVRSACRLVQWRYRDLDEALGSASNAATRWATRDWRMVQQQRRGRGRDIDVTRVRGGPQTFLDAVDGTLDLVEAGTALSPFSSPSRSLVSPRKRGSAITDVPPPTPRAPAAADGANDARDDSSLKPGPSIGASRQLVFRDTPPSGIDPADVRLARRERRTLVGAPRDPPAPAASIQSRNQAVGPTRRSSRVALVGTRSSSMPVGAAAPRSATAAPTRSTTALPNGAPSAIATRTRSTTTQLDRARPAASVSTTASAPSAQGHEPVESAGVSVWSPRRRVPVAEAVNGHRSTLKRSASGLVLESARLRPARPAKEEDSASSGSSVALSSEPLSPRRTAAPKRLSSSAKLLAAARRSLSSTSDSDSDEPPPAAAAAAERTRSLPARRPLRRTARPTRRSVEKDTSSQASSSSSSSSESAQPSTKPTSPRRTTRSSRLSPAKTLGAAARRAPSTSGSDSDEAPPASVKGRQPSPELLSPRRTAGPSRLSSAQLLAAAAKDLMSISSSDSDDDSSAAVEDARPPPAERLKPGFTRCDWEGCPNPVYKSTTKTSGELHVLNYHNTTCIITYQRPYRTSVLERDEHGLFACPWCWHRIKNATVAQQHAYGRKSCPGPPVAVKDTSSSTSNEDPSPQRASSSAG